MMNEDIKQLISSYVDEECSGEDRERAEALILRDQDCQNYYRELVNLSALLKTWDDEPASPDLDRKFHAALAARTMKGNTMKTNFHKFWAGTGVLMISLVALVFALRTYQESPAGRQAPLINTAADDAPLVITTAVDVTKAQTPPLEDEIGDMFSPELASVSKVSIQADTLREAYEPYMLESRYSEDSSTRAMARMDVAGFGHEIWTPLAPSSGIHNTEEYHRINDNAFQQVTVSPVSTFSIDVDTGSYSNVRRYLNGGQLPPVDAVRLEEMINYFSYSYPQPAEGEAFSVTLDAAQCPWNQAHQLVRVGLKGKSLDSENLPPSNLVFLIDVSGSMNDANKLPLLKQAFSMMVNQLGPKEKVAIVVYAGAAGKVLDSTVATDKVTIINALEQLTAGGSTAGGQGIQLAYEIARQNFIQGGNNRVILATDGDFNIGVSSTSEMTRLIEEKRKEGIFLTVLGFGMGNYKDGRMEQIANTGNGNYYYIDTLNEARKVLVSELGSTLFTIAKDVKIQVEFNPAKVKAYRLVGYENRLLAREDFNDDTKDAGELGAGHTVTALYEIVPAGVEAVLPGVDELKYQQANVIDSPELLTVKLRYKLPDEDTSRLISQTLDAAAVGVISGDLQWAAAVAQFGMILRQSEFRGDATYDQVLNHARAALGEDSSGYRAEFIGLVEKTKSLDVRPAKPGQIQFK